MSKLYIFFSLLSFIHSLKDSLQWVGRKHGWKTATSSELRLNQDQCGEVAQYIHSEYSSCGGLNIQQTCNRAH